MYFYTNKRVEYSSTQELLCQQFERYMAPLFLLEFRWTVSIEWGQKGQVFFFVDS